MSATALDILYAFSILSGAALALAVASVVGAWGACWWLAIWRGEI